MTMKETSVHAVIVLLLLTGSCLEAFVVALSTVNTAGWRQNTQRHVASTTTTLEDDTSPKETLLELLGRSSTDSSSSQTTTTAARRRDAVLADPVTKEALVVEIPGTLLGGLSSQRIKYNLKSSNNTYSGSSNTYLNLLQQQDPTANDNDTDDASSSSSSSDAARTSRRLLNQAAKSFVLPFLPPPLRSVLGASESEEYVPMRDLFTSPAVSFAYERGWRQGFARAGFPGPDAEYEMARDYFAPAVARARTTTNGTTATTSSGGGSSVVVDMSCATGLFTRRFASADEYDRVIGCDYSDSMLTEAKRRINADDRLQQSRSRRRSNRNRNQQWTTTQLDLVRCDVGEIPMQTESVDALHAGAAMHCWPELEAAVTEIYRVLKPGGRYFATTFLAQYFATLMASEQQLGGAQQQRPPMTTRQAFQYFESTDQLRKLMEVGGFEPDKIQIELLGPACVVIRCEK